MRQPAPFGAFVEFLWKNRWHFAPAHPTLPGMAQKRKRLVVTVTERWTFVIDDEDAAPATTPTTDLSAPVPPSSLLDAGPSVLLTKGADMVVSPRTRAPADIPTAGDDDAV